jgi:hypothetical protein
MVAIFIIISLIALFAALQYSSYFFLLCPVIILILLAPAFTINTTLLSDYFEDLQDNTKVKSLGTLTDFFYENSRGHLNFRKEGQRFCEGFIIVNFAEAQMAKISKGAIVELEYTSKCKLLLNVRPVEA